MLFAVVFVDRVFKSNVHRVYTGGDFIKYENYNYYCKKMPGFELYSKTPNILILKIFPKMILHLFKITLQQNGIMKICVIVCYI